MTGRTGLLTTEDSLLSEAESARIAAEEALHLEYERKAARVVAASATDAEDARLLFAILGIDTPTLESARTAPPKPHAGRRSTRAA